MAKWLEINKAREEEIQQKLNKDYDEEDEAPAKMIRYVDAWMHFLAQDYTKELSNIVRESENTGGGLMSVFKKKTPLDKTLQEERDIFICLAQVKMDTSIEIHDRLL